MISALIYPAILVAVAAISVVLMLGFVVPQFETLFADLGDGLPVPTDVFRPQDALAQFDYSLKRAPRRLLSLQGKLEAAKALQDEALQSELEGTLQEILKNANQKQVVSKL